MSCDFGKLAELCKDHGYGDAIKSIKSLVQKMRLAKYHRDEAVAKARLLINHPDDLTNPQDDPKWIRAQYEVEAQTIAAAQAMHSMADISAQIVNVCLGLGIPRKYVSAYGISKMLNGQVNHTDIYSALVSLLDSDAFKYMEAFVNTAKHYHLIDMNYNININAETGAVAEGVRFQQFDYERSKQVTTYPPTYAFTILDQYSSEIFEKICTLVDKLIEFMERP